ncbi:MAG: hypothetical protein A3J38_01360 [Gammaproteobacteria bacterium RIFCSPHIGHO2_12_FULL_45_9]|nr:MAG: hypothetical protein A3J38_01360 [Gammaproteobacteria bacterium RIFCSPHIGHO2_12_FULL_45_9]
MKVSWLTQFTQYLLKTERRMYMAALIATLLPWPLSFLAPMWIGLVTYCKGIKTGLVTLAWVALPAIAFLVLRKVGVFDALLLRAVLLWVLMVCWMRIGRYVPILLGLSGLGVLGVLGVHWMVPDVPAFWMDRFHQLIPTQTWIHALHVSAGDFTHMLATLAPIATGFLLGLMVVGAFLQLLLARIWACSLGRRKNMHAEWRAEMLNLHMPFWFGVIACVSSGLTLWRPEWLWLRDCMPVVAVPLVFNALSLLHNMAAHRKQGVYILSVAYVCLFLFTYWMAIALAILGVVDSFVHIRKRLGWSVNAQTKKTAEKK